MTRAYRVGRWAGKNRRAAALLLVAGVVVTAVIVTKIAQEPANTPNPSAVPPSKLFSQEDIEKARQAAEADAQRRAEAERQEEELRRKREENLARAKQAMVEDAKRHVKACVSLVRQRTDA